MSRSRNKSAICNRAVLVISLTLLAAVVLPGVASAAGFFETLFGGGRAPSAPSNPTPLFQALGNIFGGSGTSERRSEGGGSTAYCVRLCDGHPFPVQNAGMTPTQACNSACPASQTKVFNGGSVDNASSSDGKRYADLPNAFVYRQRIVAGCTCNGRTAGGLVSIDAKSDPTLRPGDMVATNDGLVAYKGRKDATAEFTPVQDRKLTQIKISPAAANAHAEAPPPEQIPPSAGNPRKRAQADR